MPEGGFLCFAETEKCAWPSRETNARRQSKRRYVFAALLNALPFFSVALLSDRRTWQVRASCGCVCAPN